MCSLLFSQRISRALSVYICLVFLVACPSNTICFSFLSLLSPQCTEPGMLCLSFPSVYWTLLNVPRQKVEATHLSSLFCSIKTLIKITMYFHNCFLISNNSCNFAFFLLLNGSYFCLILPWNGQKSPMNQVLAFKNYS